jgi:hypothetical protein
MEQGADYFDPGRIPKDLEQIRQVQQVFFPRHKAADIGDHVLVYDIAIAIIGFSSIGTHHGPP